MRLSKQEIDLLKTKVKSFSKNAKIYLFGSRVDDTKKGGDIDILILSNDLSKKDIRKIRVEFFKQFGEQKLDILLDDGSLKDTFTKLVFKKAILL